MSPAPHCYGAVNFEAFRTSRLDALGQPDPGTDNLYVTEAGIAMQVQPQVTEGATKEQKNGKGNVCVSWEDCDRISKVNLALTLCQFDVELAEILSAGDLWTDGDGNSVGYALPDPGDPCPNGVCIEAWALAVDGEDRAAYNGNPAYWRYLFPKVTWVLGDHNVEDAVLVQAWNGKSRSNGNIGNGPFGDWPGVPAGPYAYYLTDTFPDVLCGYQELEPVPS